jgi:ATP-dependent RNA helicase RhlE
MSHDKTGVVVQPVAAMDVETFADLGLSAPILRALKTLEYTVPTPIQKAAVPAVLAGRDLLAAAQTGTGKTAGFVLPIIERLSHIDFSRVNNKAKVRVLILTPTRELASQVEESVRLYGQYVDVKSMVMFGGVNINPQKQRLNKRVDVLVATPGRLLDHIQQGTLDLSGVETFVLDEADRMLDMGFIRDIRKILPLLPKQRQSLLFSATFSDEIKTLAAGILNNPVHIEVARSNSATAQVHHVVHPVDRERKQDLLVHLITTGQWQQVLVFARTKHGSDRLTKQLEQRGISAMAIHGNKSQAARERALREFKAGGIRVMVATDIAARGIDIDQLPHVVNYELPNTPEDYVHRIGRTGRAGMEGHACSLACIDELGLLANIEKLLKTKLPSQVIAGFEVDPRIKAEPLRKPQVQRPPRQGAGVGQRQGQGQGKQGAPRGDAAKPKTDHTGHANRSEQPKTDKPRTGNPKPAGQSRPNDSANKPNSPRRHPRPSTPRQSD